MSEPTVAWPPSRDQRQQLARLGEMIRRFGAERFTGGHLVRADLQDFPDAWDPTLSAVHGLLYRLFWHAYLDPEVVVDDIRRPTAFVEQRMLRTTEIELASAGDGRVAFDVAAIGNDDVAGLLSHRVGAAFLELAPPDPFRETRTETTEADGSTAACYLGLGVLVANSALYRRHASRLEGKLVHTEEFIASAGGLSIADATFLLAVQDVVRDDYQDALTTLHPPQADWHARWVEVLEPHEDELRTLLGLDDAAAGAALTRAAAPHRPAAIPERDLSKFNHGRTTFRVPVRPAGRALAGAALGVLALILFMWIATRYPSGMSVGIGAGVGVILLGAIIGWRMTPHSFVCADTECRALMASELPVCPGCGGTIAETIAHADLRLARLDELEGAPADDDG